MSNPDELAARLEEYGTFLSSIGNIDNRVWSRPIREGKWSIHDIIAHIMGWDKNFVEKILPDLLGRGSVPLEEDSDPQLFNNRSVEYGRTLTRQRLLEESLRYRSGLIAGLKKLPGEAFSAKVKVGKAMTLSAFLERMFILHDQHHEEQIQSFLGLGIRDETQNLR